MHLGVLLAYPGNVGLTATLVLFTKLVTVNANPFLIFMCVLIQSEDLGFLTSFRWPIAFFSVSVSQSYTFHEKWLLIITI